MTQQELFIQRQVGNLSIETPVVGRITQLTDHVSEVTKMVWTQGNAEKTDDHISQTGKMVNHMHAGKIGSSIRLKRTLEVLRDGWKTTLEIEQHTNSRAVHSDIAALRVNGVAVESECMPGRIWRYRLA